MPHDSSLIGRLLPARLRMPRLRWILIVMPLLVVGLGVSTAVLVRPNTTTVTYYACVRTNRVVWYGTSLPTSCPRGSDLIRDDLEIDDPQGSLARRITLQLRRHLTIPDVMIGLSVVSLIWILAGWQLDGMRLLLAWVLVPIFAFVAAVCVAGPGNWFPKEPYEGPSVIPLGGSDAITVLDLVGFTIASVTIVSAVLLVVYRRRHSRASRPQQTRSQARCSNH